MSENDADPRATSRGAEDRRSRPQWSKVWDSGVARFAAIAGYLLAAVYISGALIVWLQLFWRSVPSSAVLGQLPKQYLITVGFEQVFVPSGITMLCLALVLKREFQVATWATKATDSGARRALAHLPVAATLAAVTAVASGGLFVRSRRNTHLTAVEVASFIFAGLVILLWLMLEVRRRVVEHRWGGAVRAQRFFVALATLPIVLAVFIAVGSTQGFATVFVCRAGEAPIQGNLITQDSNTAYLLQTFRNDQTNAALQVIPRSSFTSLSIGTGPCP